MDQKLVSIILVLVVAVVIGGLWYVAQSDEFAPVACTMEAKICPDGSSVGRQGPDCEFAVCPANSARGAVTGTDVANRVVVIRAADGQTYNLNLQPNTTIRDRNDVTLDVDVFLSQVKAGDELKVTGVFDSSNQIIPDVIELIATDVGGDTQGMIAARIDQGASAMDIKIVPRQVLEDSRCPVDVVCVQAGTVRLRAVVTNDGAEESTIFTLNQTIAFGNHDVALVLVEPSRRATVNIAPGEYLFHFAVSQQPQSI